MECNGNILVIICSFLIASFCWINRKARSIFWSSTGAREEEKLMENNHTEQKPRGDMCEMMYLPWWINYSARFWAVDLAINRDVEKSFLREVSSSTMSEHRTSILCVKSGVLNKICHRWHKLVFPSVKRQRTHNITRLNCSSSANCYIFQSRDCVKLRHFASS